SEIVKWDTLSPQPATGTLLAAFQGRNCYGCSHHQRWISRGRDDRLAIRFRFPSLVANTLSGWRLVVPAEAFTSRSSVPAAV
ncbi:MAG: hypothetical protein ACKPEY_10060, partial [Planctomycetota bacterium]